MPSKDEGRGTALVFLDRDGTIIVEKNYLADPAGVELETHALAGLQRLSALGARLFVVSNQSGVGRGYFGLEAVDAVNRRVDELLKAGGVKVESWHVCPHEPATPCDCRKPFPGLVLEAERVHGFSARGCFVVGDKRSDVELAGHFDGVGILVSTGHSSKDVEWAHANGHPVCADLLEVARLIEGMSK